MKRYSAHSPTTRPLPKPEPFGPRANSGPQLPIATTKPMDEAPTTPGTYVVMHPGHHRPSLMTYTGRYAVEEIAAAHRNGVSFYCRWTG